MSVRPISVLIVDDSASVRQVLSTAARYSQPSPFGTAAEKSCLRRLGAIGRSWRLSVVHGRKRRPARARMP